MNRFQRAMQIWSVLAWAATNRQSMTYVMLSGLTGVPAPGLGQLLEPIQSYCLVHGLPPLTILVVQKDSGMPGSGFTGASATELASKLQEVFRYDWIGAGCPLAEAFEAAIDQRPSNG